MMQYPPQGPTNQPYYPPSEMYVPEQPQPQGYAPAQANVPAQGIAIYAKRGQTMARAIVCIICFLIIVLIIPLMAILSSLAGQPLGIGDIAPVFIVIVPAAVFIGWVSWSMLSMLRADKPVLLINHEGIVVSSTPMLSGFSISWGEIAVIFPSRYMYKYLCITPKNPDLYLKAHFSSPERLLRQLNSMIGSPLYVPQMYLGKQVEEILQQLYHIYAKELAYYQVQIRS